MKLLSTLVVLSVLTSSALAQNAIPEPPEPIQNLIAEGAQARYLGNDYGADGWMTMKNGQEQYFYVLPGGQAFLMGVMFDNKGKIVTVDQVRRLREGGDPTIDALAERPKVNEQPIDNEAFQTPAEQMYRSVSESNWIAFGDANAPAVYAFVDPNCGHCHTFYKDMKNDVDAGKVQLRLIPVGVLSKDSLSQAAFLLAAPAPQEKWDAHMSGDAETALPIKDGLNEQGVMRNMAVMQSWKLDATPIVIYKDRTNKVKIVRGKPKNSAVIVNDVGAL